MKEQYDLILLDRDGVINRDLPISVRSLSDFDIISSSLKAIAHLSAQGFKIAIVTNQAVIGRGELSPETLDEIHDYMLAEIQKSGGHIDHIYVCHDTDIEPNNRRKPAPGMLLEALSDFGVPADRALMIGDALRDLQAAQNAGIDSWLVRTGKGRATEKDLQGVVPKGIYDDLHQAVLKNFL